MGLDVLHDFVHQQLGAVGGQRRNAEHGTLPVQRTHDVFAAALALVERQQIDLVQHQPAFTCRELRAEFFELASDHLHVVRGISIVIRRQHVYEVQQQAGAREMFQKPHPEAGALGRAFDQAGDVGDHEAALIVDAHHPQAGNQGRKRVIRLFGPRRRDGADQRRLAGGGLAQQPDGGQHLQLQIEFTHFARRAFGELAWRTVGAAFETGVADAVAATLRQAQALAGGNQVADDFAGVAVAHHRADRYRDDEIVAALTDTVATHAVLAALCLEFTGVAKIDQGIEIDVGDQKHTAAVAAVAAVRPAERDEFFAAQTRAAITAVAGLDFAGDFQIVLAAAEFDDLDLVAAAVALHSGGHLATGHEWRADLDALALTDHQHLVEFDGAALFGIAEFDLEGIALRHAVLYAARDENCVHGKVLRMFPRELPGKTL